ncbi:ribosomal protein L4, partial [Lojkania enalia]
MAPSRMRMPVRGVTSQLSLLSISQDKSITTLFARTITSSMSSRASVSTITTVAAPPVPTKPFGRQTVSATIYHFPTLEPLRFQSYPANHLYLPTRRDILHRAIVFEGDNTRSGTASTKWRDEVRGSARKLRPQKGTGRARLGDKKSPMLTGGGVAFGPKPRDFGTDLPRKVYDLAWRTALSYRYKKGELVIVDNAMELESPSPTLLKLILDSQGWGDTGKKSLLVTLNERPLLAAALERLSDGYTRTWQDVDVKDLLGMGRIVIERNALNNMLQSHQYDLTHNSRIGRLVETLPEEEIVDTFLGYEEYRDLVLVPREEREALKPTIFRSIGLKRVQRALDLDMKASQMLEKAIRAEQQATKQTGSEAEAILLKALKLRQAAEEKKTVAQNLAHAGIDLQIEAEELESRSWPENDWRKDYSDARTEDLRAEHLDWDSKNAENTAEAEGLREEAATLRDGAQLLREEAEEKQRLLMDS